jgi:peptidoglycan hydrolase-like protein with peptidoglycan-binding domain
VTAIDSQKEQAPSLDEVAALVGGQRGKARRQAAVAGIVGLVVGAGGVGGLSLLGGDGEESTRTSVALATVAVETRDVTLYTEYAGTLGYGDALDVVTRADGVITAIPGIGGDLARGDTAFEVDEEPVALLYGALPAWRTLTTDSDDGPDVLQLETNLAALGYSDDLAIDENFTSVTAANLKAFETALGQSDPDGELDPGEVVFTTGPIRIDDVLSRGTTVSPGTSVITAALLEDATDTVTDGDVTTTSTPTQAVTFTIASTDQGGFAVGDAVVVELADERLTDGVVSALSDTPRRNGTGPSADLVLDVTVSITEVPEGGLIEGPANVRITDQVQEALTMVPVRALVALAEGGYAVSVVADDGSSHLVGVDTGLFQDGWVAIVGDADAGDMVEVPQ